jgi:hypothetical protein
MPYVPIDCRQGLHCIQDSVNQLTYMEQHSTELLRHLNVIVEVTYAMSPKRVRPYALNRIEGRLPNERNRELLLEKAIWKRWRRENNGSAVEPPECFVENHCTHIQTCQMPLQDRRTDASWGRIDLIGVSLTGTPIVFELKREKAPDTPLRMLVEGLAYAVAVRKAWNQGTLRGQWLQHLVTTQNVEEIPLTLLTVPVVGIAPTDFWSRRTGNSGPNRVKKEAWQSFNKLCEACKERGFPISFLTFDAQKNDEHQLPLIENVCPLQLPS